MAALIYVACREWAKRMDVGGDFTSERETAFLNTIESDKVPKSELEKNKFDYTKSGNDSNFPLDSAKSTSMEGISQNPNGVVVDQEKIKSPSYYATLFSQRYNEMSNVERAMFEEWWKWFPGRHHRSSHRGSYGRGRSIDRLRGFEAALVGCLRDWCPSKNGIGMFADGGKWRILAKLFQLENDSNQQNDKHISNSIEKDTVGMNNMSSTSDEDIRDESDKDENDDDERKDSLMRMSVPRELRKRSAVVDYSDENAFIGLDNGLEDTKLYGLRKRTRINSPSDREFRSRHDRNARSAQRKRMIDAQEKLEADIAKEQDESYHAIQLAESGFSSLNIEERIAIFKFLIDEVGSQWSDARKEIEENVEKVSELKREKREIIRERKNM